MQRRCEGIAIPSESSSGIIRLEKCYQCLPSSALWVFCLFLQRIQSETSETWNGDVPQKVLGEKLCRMNAFVQTVEEVGRGWGVGEKMCLGYIDGLQLLNKPAD